jgi:hypothetical protein
MDKDADNKVIRPEMVAPFMETTTGKPRQIHPTSQ